MERLATFSLNDNLNKDNHQAIPSLYVACKAAYKAGLSHGCWMDATQDLEDLQEAIEQMLAESPIRGAERWMIQHHNFGCDIKPYEDLEALHEKAVFIEKHGALGVKLLDDCADVEDAQSALADHYRGEYPSEVAFTHHLLDVVHGLVLPDRLKAYIDYQAFSSDLFISEYRSLALENAVHVFSYGQ